jgi:hypothetical protein
MIKKFESFILENTFNTEMLKDIENVVYLLDDIDVEYTIEEFIDMCRNRDTYNIGYKINIIYVDNFTKEQDLIFDVKNKIVAYLKDLYDIMKVTDAIIVCERKKLLKNDVIKNLIKDEEKINKVNNFVNLALKNIEMVELRNMKIWKNNYNSIFKLENNVYSFYNIWWLFFVKEIELNYVEIRTITKAIIEDFLNETASSIIRQV